MSEIDGQQTVRNFVQVLDMSDYLVETELFPKRRSKLIPVGISKKKSPKSTDDI